VTPLAEALARIATDLRLLSRPWALVGGLAVSAHAAPARLTRDVDVAIAVSGDPEAEALIRDLQGRGYGTESMLEQSAVGRLATMRLISPVPRTATVIVDLLFASSGIEVEIVAAADPITTLGHRIPIAKLGHLLALKVLANRPQDQMDGARLILAAGEVEMRRARKALDLIAERGFAREEGRDLQAELTRWIERAPEIA
jgi:hypothetical protein